MSKIRIGVLYGGRSGEHEVSLLSAHSVMKALNPEIYEIIPIGIRRDGQWVVGTIDATFESCTSATLIPSALQSPLYQWESDTMSVLSELDVIFPVLHGTFGEDGTMQGFLELVNVPYIGCGVVGSAVGMDKAIFKAVMDAHQIPILPWSLVLRNKWQSDINGTVAQLEEKLTYPMFTKPANLGSSVGIMKCSNQAELLAGLEEAFLYDLRVVVEQGIPVRELEVAVLGNNDPEASVVGEIAPDRDFYDFEAKYKTNDSKLMIPAPIDADLSDRIRAMAIDAYQAIDAAGLGRVDFLLNTETDELYINEINTLPGFTNLSMYPKLWENTGLPYSFLLDRLVQLAIERFNENRQRKFE